MNRYFTIILNPIADNGNAKKKKSLIEEFFSKNAADFKIILTERVGHATSIAASYTQIPDHVIVAAGGDGTSNEVINGLMLNSCQFASSSTQQNRLPFGVLPIGRGNDFAFGAGIPRDLTESMRLLLEGILYPIDVGLIIGGDFPKGRYFGNGVGIGFDAIVGLEAAKMKYLHGAASYIVAAIKTLVVRPKAPTIEIFYQDRQQIITPALISIMNGKRMGGAFFMAPDGDMSDGLLNLTITYQGTRISLLKAMILYLKGKQSRHQGTITDSAEKISLKALSGSMTAHADGETICVAGTTLEIQIIPSALQLITMRNLA
jgi:YegS/Rv2252/BmrU family lipid kinase